MAHYSETASLNCNFERVRSDRGLGQYSPKIVYVLSGGAVTGFCHFRQVEIVLASDEFKEFERKYFGERKPADGHVQSGIRHFLVGLAGTLKNGMHLGKALATSAMVAEKDAVSIFSRIFEGAIRQVL